MRYFIFALMSLLFSCKGDVESVSLADGKAEVVKFSDNSKTAEKEIRKVLMDQQVAWNEGSIDKFMQSYWKSENLTFIGKSGVNKGWQTTLDNYKKSYPDKATMGLLFFKVLELDRLSNDVYRMIGTYELKREKDNPTGIFTLIWQFIDGQWLITSDQTCG